MTGARTMTGTPRTMTGAMTGARTMIPALTSSGLRAALKTATVALKTTTLALKTTTLTLKMAMVVATKLTTRTATSHPLSTSRPLSPLTIHHHHHSHGHHHHNHVHHHGSRTQLRGSQKSFHPKNSSHPIPTIFPQLATLKVAREKRARARARAKAKAMTCSRRASSPTTPRMTF